jgi:hypothetical protein
MLMVLRMATLQMEYFWKRKAWTLLISESSISNTQIYCSDTEPRQSTSSDDDDFDGQCLSPPSLHKHRMSLTLYSRTILFPFTKRRTTESQSVDHLVLTTLFCFTFNTEHTSHTQTQYFISPSTLCTLHNT